MSTSSNGIAVLDSAEGSASPSVTGDATDVGTTTVVDVVSGTVWFETDVVVVVASTTVEDDVTGAVVESGAASSPLHADAARARTSTIEENLETEVMCRLSGNDHHGARGVVGQPICNRPDDKAFENAGAASADDQHVGVSIATHIR